MPFSIPPGVGLQGMGGGGLNQKDICQIVLIYVKFCLGKEAIPDFLSDQLILILSF